MTDPIQRAQVRRISWVDVVTGIGVVVSLIFVGVQIRENTKAIRSSTITDITDQVLGLNALLITVPELRAAYSKAVQGKTTSLTPEEADALTFWYASVLRVAENRFRQGQLGTYPPEVAASGSGAVAYRLPFFKSYWMARRHTYAPDFAAFVDSVYVPLVQDSFPGVPTDTRQ
jgi:hypothetical protein